MDELLATYALKLTESQKDTLEAHLQFVLEKNTVLNLTRVTDYQQALTLHVLDSLLVLPELMGAPQGMLLDMGTGAGYPGLPLAVLSGRRTLLLDAREKKITALNEFIFSQRGHLANITARSGRAEDLARTSPQGFTAVTARALSALPSLLELASPLLKPGGHLIALKGHPDEAEVHHAEQIKDLVGMRLASRRSYSLPSGEQRQVFVYERMNVVKMALPRHVGFAQRKPLA